MVLRRIYGPKKYWRSLHNAEVRDLNFLPNDIRLMKSRKIKLTGHVASMGEKRRAYRFWWEILRKRDHLEGLSIDWRTILKWIFEK
jgi:hypothetical protein